MKEQRLTDSNREINIKGTSKSDRLIVELSVPIKSLTFEGNPNLIAGQTFMAWEDEVTFAQNLDMTDSENTSESGDLKIYAEKIMVDPGTIIDLRGERKWGNIEFRAKSFGLSELESLNPLQFDTKTTEITLGANSKLFGETITIRAESEEKTLAELLGLDTVVDSYVVQPLIEYIQDFTALPFKVQIEKSIATVDVGTDAVLEAPGGISIDAVATASAQGVAAAETFAIAYAEATAEATVVVKTRTRLSASYGAVKVSAEANANSDINVNSEGQDDGSGGKGMSIGITSSTNIAHATVEPGVRIDAGKVVNVVAEGANNTSSNSTALQNDKGTASLAFGISISKADLKSEVDGKITANHVGDVVKIEFDPTEKESNKTGYIDVNQNTIYVADQSVPPKTFNQTAFRPVLSPYLGRDFVSFGMRYSFPS